jgi:hypothetical protein
VGGVVGWPRGSRRVSGGTARHYPDAGHAIGYPVPYQALDFLGPEGVSPEADAAARADASPRFLSWLDAISG